MTEYIVDRGPSPVVRLLFAHGAGAPMDSHYMQQFAQLLIQHPIEVVRFEFPYMTEWRRSGKKRPPNTISQLVEYYGSVFQQFAHTSLPVFCGGKSMGGRIATLFAEQFCGNNLQGLICLGYPFHPVGKPEKTRVDHLKNLSYPSLIIQGERDGFGKPDEVAGYVLAKSIRIMWLESADHDFIPLKSSGSNQANCLTLAAQWAAEFMLQSQ